MPQSKLIDDILLTLPNGEVHSVTVGLHWTAVVVEVEGRLHAGLSTSFWREDEPVETAEYLDYSALELAALVRQPLSYQTGIGAAAVNALLPSPIDTVDINAEQVIAGLGRGKRVVMVGHFPFTDRLRRNVGHLDVLEKRPRPGDLPAEAAPDVVPQAAVVAITGTTLVNGTFTGLLELCPRDASVIVLGPTTFLSPVLFKYSVDILCGSVVEDIPAVVESVWDAQRFSDVHHAGVRLVSMQKR